MNRPEPIKAGVHMKKRADKLSFSQILMLSYIAILGIILIIGIVLYTVSNQQVKNGINQQNRLSLSSSVTRLDTSIEVMNAVARQIASNSSFNSLAALTKDEDPAFFYAGYKAQQDVETITPIERLLPIRSSFIYITKSNYILSSIVFSDFDFYMRNNAGAPGISEAFSEFLTNSENWNKFIPPFPGTNQSLECLYLYPLSSKLATPGKVDAVLCFEFDSDLITEFFTEINLYDTGYLTAYHKNGGQMFLIGDVEQVLDYDTLQSLDYENQIAHITPEGSGRDFLVTTKTSDYNNWTYYLVQPKKQAYYSITSYQRFFTAITFTVFLAGGIIAVFSSRTVRQHLSHLVHELTASESLATALHHQMEKQKPVVLESYMRRIMEGSITTNDEMQHIITLMDLERPDTKFLVLYTEVSPSEESNIQTDDLELCIQNYDMLVREALGRYYPDTGYLYKPSDRVFAVLLASDVHIPYEEIIEDIKKNFTALHDELLSRYGIWIRGGIGDRNGLISYTWKSYQQAKEAKTITTTEKYILSTSDFANSSDVYYYPESLAVQLSGFISTGNKDQVSELFKLIRNENTGKRNLSYTQQRWLISDIRGTVFKKRHNVSTEDLSSDKLKYLDLIDRQFEGEMSLSALKTIALELCDVYGTDTNSNDLILKIQEYINTNYHNPDLGLSKISEEFGISENYFSFLFKKEVSENFSTYLERLRMAKAKEMVLESENNLSDLYQYLGYNNAASFRRAFKKNFGVSPKEMRDKVNAK